MIEKIVNEIIKEVNLLIGLINEDIEDIKKANNDSLLERNDFKLEKIAKIKELKEELNREIIKKIKSGENINKFKPVVDILEEKLKDLYRKNKKLSSIVSPMKNLYNELIEEISANNGGKVIDVKA